MSLLFTVLMALKPIASGFKRMNKNNYAFGLLAEVSSHKTFPEN